jgi:phospholipid/cholesterol/gamma-HCH transport system substrate-binding protein
MKFSNETKVGLLLVGTLVTAALFAWLLGARNPFKQSDTYHITYNFAGGIDVGSPVRVSGIKVGKVESIEFLSPEQILEESKQKNPFDSDDRAKDKVPAPLRLRITVSKEALPSVREDSKFYINIAGIIGERYIEITPGSAGSPRLKNGATVRGIDPPRIDQLISQSFDLAGKVIEILEENEGDITKTIQLLLKLSDNINKTLGNVEKSRLFKTDLSKLINNLIEITNDVRAITSKTQTEEGKKTLKLLHDMLWRLEPVNGPLIRQFFQKEGIRTRLF